MAATQLFMGQTGLIQHPQYPNLYDKTQDTYNRRADNVPIQGAQFFQEETAETLEHKIATYGSVLKSLRRVDDSDRLPFEQPADGYSKTLDIRTFRMGTRFTQTIEKIDRSGQIRRMAMQGLPDSLARTLEYAYADVFNNGTTTAGADGSFLFANDHYHEDPSAGTWSNVETAAALTSTTYNTMRVNMRKRKNEKGMIAPITLKKLIVSPDNEQKALEIRGSSQTPETSTNAKNVWENRFDVIVYDYLTSTTGWYGWGDLMEDMWGLHVAFLTRPQVVSLGYPSPEYKRIVAGWEAYVQFAVAGSQAKNVHRNSGA